MQPHAGVGAHVGQAVQRVDRAGQRGAAVGHHGHRGDARLAVGGDRRGHVRRLHPAVLVDRQLAHAALADPGRLGRPDHRVVGLVRAVDGRLRAVEAVGARARQRVLARHQQRGHVRRHAAAGERALGQREADQLRPPRPAPGPPRGRRRARWRPGSRRRWRPAPRPARRPPGRSSPRSRGTAAARARCSRPAPGPRRPARPCGSLPCSGSGWASRCSSSRPRPGSSGRGRSNDAHAAPISRSSSASSASRSASGG